MKAWFLKRIKERSTWLGIVALATIVGLEVTDEQREVVIQAGMAVGAAIAIFTADGSAQ